MFFSNFINHFFWRGTYRNAIKHIMQKGEIISDPFWQYGWPKKWHFASLIQGVSVCEGSFAWEAVLKKLLLGGPPSAIYVAVPPLSLMVFFDRYILWCILRVILLQPTAEVDECVVECRRWWAVRGICPTWANSPLRTYIQYIPFYFSSLHFGPLTFPFTNVSLSLPVLKKVVDTKSALFTIGQKYF